MFFQKIIASLLLFSLIFAPLKLRADCYPYAPCDPCGSGYADCRGAYTCSASIALGIIIFGVMYAILCADGKTAHAH